MDLRSNLSSARLEYLDQTHAEISMVGGDAANDIARFAHVHPHRRRGLDDAAAVGQPIEIEKLIGAGGGQAREMLKCVEVVHCGKPV